MVTKISTIPTGDLRDLLLDAGKKLTSGAVSHASMTLCSNGDRPSCHTDTLKSAYARAGADLLRCLHPPEERDLTVWLDEVTEKLVPLFDDRHVQANLLNAVLLPNGSRKRDLTSIQEAYSHYAIDEDTSLVWKEGMSPSHAVETFVRALKHTVETSDGLHTFLLAVRLRQETDRCIQGNGSDIPRGLIQAVESLAIEVEKRLSFFINLARMGYSARGLTVQGDNLGSIIVTDLEKEVFIADEGTLAWLFHQLPDHQQVLAEYRAHLHRTCAHLPTDGLALPLVAGAPLPADNVYQPMDQVSLPIYRSSDQQPVALYALLDQILKSEHPTLIHGAAGVGKSLLLRRLCCTVAIGQDLHPLLVPMARVDLAMASGRSFLDAVLDVVTTHKERVDRKRLRSALEEEIKAKKILWLWDGVDQVRLNRGEVLTTLARLAEDNHRMIITSRKIEPALVALRPEIYEMPEPTVTDIYPTVTPWCTTLATARQIPEGEREEWIGSRVKQVEEQLERFPDLWKATKHRLALIFLTTLACDDPPTSLPQDRTTLITQYVERLFQAQEAQIEEERDLLPGISDRERARSDLLSGIARLARHLHYAVEEAPAEASYTAVKEVMANEFGRKAGLLGRFQTSVRVKAFIDFWEQTGLLTSFHANEQEWLVFRHPLIQQCSVASALAEIYQDRPDELWVELEHYREDDAWHDLLPLTLSQLEDATPFFGKLLEIDSDNLFLIVDLLIEGARGTLPAYQRIVDDLGNLISAATEPEEREKAFTAITRLGALDPTSYAVDKLMAMTCQEGSSPIVRRKAAEALDQLGRTEDLLEGALDQAVAGELRLHAVEALEHLGYEEWTHQAWHALGKDAEVSADIRTAAAARLNEIGNSEKAAQILLSITHTDKIDPTLRINAVEKLDEMGHHEETIQAWKALAHDPGINPEARKEAAEALELEGYTRDAVAVWSSLARDEKIAAHIRAAASYHLLYSGHEGEAAEVLVTLAQDPSVDLDVRREATEALGHLGRTDTAMKVWLSVIRDERLSPHIRLEAAEALSGLGQTDDAVATFLALVRDTKVDLQTRRQAGEGLRRLGRIEEVAQAWLAMALDDGLNSKARFEAAQALHQLNRIEDAVKAFSTVAHDLAAQIDLRKKAAQALADMSQQQEAIEAWFAIVQDEEVAGQERLASAQSLSKLSLASGTEALSILASDTRVNQWTRVEAAKELVQMGRSDAAIEMFTKLATNSKLAWWVRQGAIRSLVQIGIEAKTPQVVGALESISQDDEVTNELRGTARWALDQLK